MRHNTQAVTKRKCGAANVTAAELHQIEAATQSHALARTAVSTLSAGWLFPCMACYTAGSHCHDRVQVMKPFPLSCTSLAGFLPQSLPVCCLNEVSGWRAAW